MNKKKIIIFLSVFIAIVITIFVLVLLKVNKGVIKTEGIKVYYRIYTKDGVSKWFKNGQIAEIKQNKITGFESKIETKYNGHILYNTTSSTNDFDDNDSYDGELAGNKKDGIYGIKFNLTDELYQNYNIYYRTYNKKDGWLDWTNNYAISGDNEVDIEKIQIKVIKNTDSIDGKTKTPSIGF